MKVEDIKLEDVEKKNIEKKIVLKEFFLCENWNVLFKKIEFFSFLIDSIWHYTVFMLKSYASNL